MNEDHIDRIVDAIHNPPDEFVRMMEEELEEQELEEEFEWASSQMRK